MSAPPDPAKGLGKRHLARNATKGWNTCAMMLEAEKTNVQSEVAQGAVFLNEIICCDLPIRPAFG